MTALAMTTPQEEEREARRIERHMAKMRREAARTAEANKRVERRRLVAQVRAQLRVAEQACASAMRAYERSLDAVSACDEDDVMKLELRLRQCDRAFNAAMAASGEASFYRRKLEEARRG